MCCRKVLALHRRHKSVTLLDAEQILTLLRSRACDILLACILRRFWLGVINCPLHPCLHKLKLLLLVALVLKMFLRGVSD